MSNELAEALERLRAIKIVEAVMLLPIGGHNATMPTSFQAGYQLACEEITHRLQIEGQAAVGLSRSNAGLGVKL